MKQRREENMCRIQISILSKDKLFFLISMKNKNEKRKFYTSKEPTDIYYVYIKPVIISNKYPIWENAFSIQLIM